MKSDILVKPNAPANPVLPVNLQLLAKEVVPLLVGILVTRVLLTCIDWTELAIPNLLQLTSVLRFCFTNEGCTYRNASCLHKLHLSII